MCLYSHILYKIFFDGFSWFSRFCWRKVKFLSHNYILKIKTIILSFLHQIKNYYVIKDQSHKIVCIGNNLAHHKISITFNNFIKFTHWLSINWLHYFFRTINDKVRTIFFRNLLFIDIIDGQIIKHLLNLKITSIWTSIIELHWRFYLFIFIT